MAFSGSQGLEGFSGGKFHVDTHAVSQIAYLFDDFRGGSGDSFGVDIAAEMVFGAQQVKAPVHKLHSIGGILYYAGAEEEAFYIVSFIKFHGETADFVRGEGGAYLIVGTAVQTVFAVIDALIG